jgi:glycopeptide antibiotics resistance protein
MKKDSTSSLLRIWGFPADSLLVIVGIAAVAVATLYPFNFSIPANFSFATILERFDNTSFFKDQVNNILLFMPFGFGVASILQRKNVSPLVQVIVALIAGACLSLTVEFLQSFLPSRDPTPADIVNNTLGSFAGLFSFYILDAHQFRSTLEYIQNNRLNNSRFSVFTFLTGYIITAFFIGISWENNINLNEWNKNFPLVIGNEQTGDRPWQGTVSQISIADKAFTDEQIQQLFSNSSNVINNNNSVLANYKFDGKDNYRDISGKQPDLQWQGQLSKNFSSNQKGVSIDSSRWLKTVEPVRLINQRISTSSEFTIVTTVESANSNQKGPARIISISGDPMHRNFTIGQDNSSLALRLRTPITGQNGSDINLSVPNVFNEIKPRRIVITYARGNIQVNIDKLANAYDFNLFELYPNNLKVFAYATTFIPLGLYLTVLSIMVKRRAFNQILLICGIVLPSLIIESILINASDKSFSLVNVALGIFFTAFTALIFKVRTMMLDNG